MRSLTTQRLVGRLPREGDAEALAAIYQAPEPARWFWDGRLPTADDVIDMVRRDLAHWDEHGHGRWYWVERETGALVARCGPGVDVVAGAQEVELHWSVRPDRQGRGIATEAASAAAEASLAALDLDSVVAYAHVENLGSQAVARRAGFTREREFDYRGQPHVLFRRYSRASDSLNASSSGSSIE
jgi:ribosomal-protein-alanine N-acetyltransferase